MSTTRRDTNRRISAMRAHPVFADCSRRELAEIDGLGAGIEVAAGRTLIREGSTGRECFVTLDGTAVVSRAGELVGVIGPGSIVGEMALLDDTRRNATVVASTPMQLLVLDRREFARLRVISPAIAAALERIAAARRPTDGPHAPDLETRSHETGEELATT